MKNEAPIIFISWAEDCSRSDSIAKRLGGKSFMVYSSGWGSHYLTILFKYFSQSVKTLWLLIREQPKTIFVMTPPVLACFPVWIYARFTGGNYFIDAHSGALMERPWDRVLFLHRFFSRRAVATLVTNEFLKAIVEQWHAPALIVQDVPVVFPEPLEWKMTGRGNMTLISTFTRDEPLDIFLNAARQIPEMKFFVTGDHRNADQVLIDSAPSNVTFTGFLSRESYVGLLLASDAIISLTIFDHTMQRGAYEAAYLEKPIITSNFGILRESFYKGAVHVDNNVDSMVKGIREMSDNVERYQLEVKLLRKEKLARWDSVVNDIRQAAGMVSY